MRKLFNSVLSFALFVVVFTTNVQAIDNSVVETVNKQTESLSQVIHDAQQNAIIRLEEDITVDEIITITDKTITLDLNNQTLTFRNPDLNSIIVSEGSKLTVVGGQSGLLTSTTERKVLIRNFGTTIIESGSFGDPDLTHYALVLGDGSSDSTINGGTFNSFITSNGTQSGQSLLITGGDFNRGIYLASAHTHTTITGGNFTVSGGSAIEIDAGTLNITGGTFTNNVDTSGNETAVTNNNGSGGHQGVISAIKPTTSAANAYGSSIEITISGGTFTNTLGDVLVLANHANTYNENITHITVDIFEDIIPSNKIAIYDKISDSRGESIVNVLPNKRVSIGDTYYSTLEEAISAAKKGDTLKVLKDFTVNKVASIRSKDITLDLNGKTLNFGPSLAYAFNISMFAKLTVDDSSSQKLGRITNANNNADIFRNSGTLVINAGEFGEIAKHQYAVIMSSSSITTINGGTFEGVIYSNGTSANQTLTINGGTFKDMLYLAGYNTLTEISGGRFEPDSLSSSDAAIEIDAGKLVITGGHFEHNILTNTNSTSTPTNNNGTGGYKGVIVAVKPSGTTATGYGSEIELVVKGGTFLNELGDVFVLANQANVQLAGVTEISASFDESYRNVSTFAVSIYDKNGLASQYATSAKYKAFDSIAIGSEIYDSLHEALAEAVDGDVITILKDIYLTEGTVVKGKEVTLDLNGMTIEFGPNIDPSVLIELGAQLTVTDSSHTKDGEIINKNYRSDIFKNYGKLIINEGIFGTIGVNNFAVYMGDKTSDTVINGGTFNGRIYSNGSTSGQKLVINDGIFTDMLYLAAKDTETTINDGYFAPDPSLGLVAAIEIDAGTLLINDGTFINNINTNSNTTSTPTNNNGIGGYKGVIVAVKPTLTTAAGYGSTIHLTIKGGSFSNTLGHTLVLANRADVQLTGVTEIIANIEATLVDVSDIKVYDNPGLDTKFTTKINTYTYGALQIGSQTYDSLAEALAAAQSGDTIKVLRDLVINKGVEVSGNAVTLDLNGKSIEFGPNIDPSILIKHGAKLTVTDSTPSKLGTITNVKNGTDIFRNGGELVLKAGTFGEVDKDHYVVYMLSGNSSTVIDGGTINGLIYSNGSTAGQQLTINGGTFKGMLYLAAKDTYTLITGGHFEPHEATESNAAIEIDAGTLVIEGGTFVHEIVSTSNSVTTPTNNNGTGSYTGVIVAVKPTGTTAAGYGSTIYLTIKGGTFTNSLGDVLVLANQADVQVTSVTDIRVEIYEAVLTEADYHIYDKLGLDTEFTTKVDEYFKVNYVIVKDNLEVTYFSQFVLKGSKAMLPSLPFYSGYVTGGWLNADQAITGNTTLKAYFTVEQFEVVFFDHTGNVIDTQTVDFGKAATAPTGMTRVGYTFKGWDTPYSSVTTDLEVKPIYEVIPIEDKVESNLGELVVKGLESVLTPEEIAAGVTAAVEVGELSLDLLDEEEKQILTDFFKSVLKTDNPTVILLDITLKKVSANGSEPISETSGEIELSFDLPKAFEGKSFNVIRIHNGVIEILEHEIDPVTGAVTFKTDRFSTYGVVSAIAPTPEQPNEPGSPVQPNVPVTPEQPKEDGKLPTTGIQSNTSSGYLFLILGFAIILSNKRVRKYSKRSH